MKYNYNKLIINSELEVKTLEKYDNDIDLIINLDSRVVNLSFEGLPEYIIGRIQLTEVKAILFRYSENKNNATATIHFLRVIDLNSSLMNFSLDYSTITIDIVNGAYAVEFIISKRG